MKKLLLLSFLLLPCQISYAQQHTVRRTLVEEFTSSSCDPCFSSDPVIEQFEGEAPGKFCIVKWYTQWGTAGGTNPYYKSYPLSTTRSESYYFNSDVATIFLNGGNPFNPFGLGLDQLRDKVTPEYGKTSPFVLDITQQIKGDSLIANLTVRLLDTTIDLSNLSIGAIITERYNQFTDINHTPHHTHIVRGVLPTLDPKNGAIRDPLPFVLMMNGQMVQTFRFATKLGVDWDQYGLASVGVIQNNLTHEVLQCNWTVPEIKFTRTPQSTYLIVGGKTACQFTLSNTTDSAYTIYPQLTHTAPLVWKLFMNGIEQPSFLMNPHSTVSGSFEADRYVPIRGSAEFILLMRTNPGIVVGQISASLIGNDSRDLIIKNNTQSVYQSDPDIVAWKNFGLDAAIINDDAVESIFGPSLLRFRTVYVTRSLYGNLSQLESIRNYMAYGGRMIFNSYSAYPYYSASIADTTVNKYAPTFENVFRSQLTHSTFTWSKGNVAIGNVFSDTLQTPFVVSQRSIDALTPIDTFSKPLFREQGGKNIGMAIESEVGKIAYITFPLSDIQNQTLATQLTGQILTWFALPNSKVNPRIAEDISAEVYPNPVSANTTIRFPESSAKPLLTVHDELGRLVNPSVRDMSTEEIHLDCSALSTGTYYYSLQLGDMILRGKFIVGK
ncbi:MAG: T9SS type A sorting domain-containing protein [Ignavibacteriota bacterium]